MWKSVLLFLIVLGPTLRAHSIFLNSLWVEYTPTELDVKVQVSVKEICTAGDLVFDIKDPENQAAVEGAAKGHLAYLLSHLSVSVDGAEAKGELVEIQPPATWVLTAADVSTSTSPTPEEGVDRLHFVFRLKYPCSRPPSRITLSQSMMSEFSYTPGTPFDFSYLVRVTQKGVPAKDFGNLAVGGLFDIETDYAASQPAGSVALPEKRTAWTRAHEFIHLGVHHVLTGYDHLLFAAALVLALRGFWEVFKIIGIFTLAHSITVTLCAYRLVEVPDRLFEPVIAGSIVWVAVENIFFPQHAKGWRRAGWTFFFGLIHGLGFGGALLEHMEGFSGGLVAMTVIAFCVGVELGHLCIVGPLTLFLTRGRYLGGERFSGGAMRYGSALVALGGLYFLLNALQWLPESLTPEVLFHMT